jgi:photosystem II stability/assembly factor-like uncharacterized protein
LLRVVLLVAMLGCAQAAGARTVGDLSGLDPIRPAAAVAPTLPAALLEYEPCIQAMVDRVSGDSLWTYIARLSGQEPISTTSGPETLLTRYSLSPQIDLAAEYLEEVLRSRGLDVEYEPYVIGQVAFYASSFVDASTGWVAGSDHAVYGTRDGGRSWERTVVPGDRQPLWGVWFVDDERGWVCGTSGSIYRTRDGGGTWIMQPTPTGVTLHDVCFLDSLEGWAVGDGGEILHTANGGTGWSRVESGTGAALYSLDFVSSGAGWACGDGGIMLAWDGAGWNVQATPTTERLEDVDFADGDLGWAVGGAGTILRTENAGMEWVPETPPEGASPFLNSVAAHGSSEAWIVGLNGTILHTGDGGTVWETQPSGTLFGLNQVWFDGAMTGWTVGYGSTILFTSDGGLSWESRRENLPSEAVVGLKNVVATLHGTTDTSEVIICGHFDSISEAPFVRAPGADDNGSGTAAVIEAARILSSYRFERTIKFICFSGEEQGVFGSGEYAAGARRRGEEIVGVVNLDMVAYTGGTGREMDIVGNGPSEWLADLGVEFADLYVPALRVNKVIDPLMVLSDHASFWKAGYQAVLGTESADVPYPYYHTTGDTLGNLDKPFATDVARLGLALVAGLARPDTTGPGPDLSRPVSIAGSFPNPFRTRTRIGFRTGVAGIVRVRVTDVLGRQVRMLVRRNLGPGTHAATWDGRDDGGARAAPGVYFVDVTLGSHRAASRVVLLR